MKKEGTILVVDDNKNILSALNLLLSRYFKQVATLNSPNNIESELRNLKPDVVLLDMNFTASVNTGNEGLYWLSKIKAGNPSVQVVVFTAYADIDLAVEAIKKGATDFVVKPWDNEKLVATLLNAYSLRKATSTNHNKKENTTPSSQAAMHWGADGIMQQLRSTVLKVAATDANILITGENGTGKEMLAQEIHRLSCRDKEPWVAVDMGAIAETLFESELFGHVKGAFTDANIDRAGKFEAANAGTLFLDEIGNLPLHLQAKLLTAIQSKQIVRVGSNKTTPIDIRLICATNCNLEQMVADGRFREDLLYRINTIHLDLPPLRKRTSDILSFADIFLKKYATKYSKSVVDFDKAAQEELTVYPWHGNIRELQHAIEKAVILSDGNTITHEALHLKPITKKSGNSFDFSTLEQMERNMIVNAIERNRGNMSTVAEQLGITRQTLYNKIKKYEI